MINISKQKAMTQKLDYNKLISLGALVALVGYIMSGPVAFVIVRLIKPQPPWVSNAPRSRYLADGRLLSTQKQFHPLAANFQRHPELRQCAVDHY